MRVYRGSAVLTAIFAVAAALGGSCRTAPPRAPIGQPSPPIIDAPSTLPGIPEPSVRIGILTGVSRVSIGAPGGVVAYGKGPGVGPEPFRLARASFAAVGAAAAAPARYRLQVASLREEAGAWEVARRIERATAIGTSVRWSEDTKTYQVRVGAWESREQAAANAGRLEPLGFPKPWVVEETLSTGDGRLRLLETAQEIATASLAPARPGEFLSVDGLDYRGLIELRADESGQITVINVVGLEDYLRGVVPNELSPTAYPQLEALKAQAVAARTYVVRNRGQYQGRGYDICATPACQVYRGRSTEHPLSDQAVAETAGLVAWSGGRPINALYTSTCGGHTEDGDNVFEGEAETYLAGVACVPERSAWTSIRTTRGPRRGAGYEAALLENLGVLEETPGSAAETKVDDEELRAWTQRLVQAVRRKGCPATPARRLKRRAAFFKHVVESLCWDERARRLLAPGDSDYLLQVEDRGALAEDERSAAAILVQEEVLVPFEDNTLRPDADITRAEAIGVLARLAVKVGAPAFKRAPFREVDAGRLKVGSLDGADAESFALEPGVRLFRALGGTKVSASELVLAAGDRVGFVVREGRVGLLEAEQSPLGPSADRTSRYYRWEVRMTPDEIARAIERYGRVGRVTDVVPRRLGVSGRVVELAVLGTEGELLLKGLKVRWGLGLRENLFVVDREAGPDGTTARYVFTGKGWGHGVGLCQVGASGMALAGAGYEDILRHYYRGVSVRHAQ